jgi:hypothetical protein
MRQRWAELLFLHWVVPAETLQALLPPALTVDTHDGLAYVGLVPFTMTGVRPLWAPALPWLSSFHEVNVRTYVHRAGREPGVWFFSLDAANPLAVLIARGVWRLPYHKARMHLHVRGALRDYGSTRQWPGVRPAQCRLAYEPLGVAAPARPGTLEHFLAERYILYTVHGGRLLEGRVHHAPYPLQAARLHDLDENLLAAAGLTRPATAPLAHYAREVQVELFALRALADA